MKLRGLIRALMWIWSVGSLIGIRVLMRMSYLQMTLIESLVVWAIIGVGPALVLKLILYLMPGGGRKIKSSSTPHTSE